MTSFLFLQELIEGESLAELIASGALYATDQIQGDAEAVLQRRSAVCLQLLAALAHVHACGVLHQMSSLTTSWSIPAHGSCT